MHYNSNSDGDEGMPKLALGASPVLGMRLSQKVWRGHRRHTRVLRVALLATLLAMLAPALYSCSLITGSAPAIGSYQYNIDLIDAVKANNPTYCAYDGLVVLKIADKESTLTYSANRYTLKSNLKKSCVSGDISMILFGPLNIPVATAEYNASTSKLHYSSSYDKNPEQNAQSIYRVLVTYGNLLNIPLKTPEEYYNVTINNDDNTYLFRSTVDAITVNHKLQIIGIYLNDINGTIGYKYRRNGELQSITYEDELYRLQMDFQESWTQMDRVSKKGKGDADGEADANDADAGANDAGANDVDDAGGTDANG